MLNERILDKASEINKLLLQIEIYSTHMEIMKFARPLHSIKLYVNIYTSVAVNGENGEKGRKLAYIMKQEIYLTDSSAESQLDSLIEKIKELIQTNNNND